MIRKFKIIAVTIKRVSLLVANGNRFEKREIHLPKQGLEVDFSFSKPPKGGYKRLKKDLTKPIN